MAVSAIIIIPNLDISVNIRVMLKLKEKNAYNIYTKQANFELQAAHAPESNLISVFCSDF